MMMPRGTVVSTLIRALRVLAALSTLACAQTASRSAETSPAGDATTNAGRTLELTNGNWLRGGRFVAQTRFVVNGALRDRAPGRPDSAIDLYGGFVVPPFGEAHNHNIEASSRVDALIARYLRDGVFYVQ